MNNSEKAIGFYELLPPIVSKFTGFHQTCLEALDNQAMLLVTVSPEKYHQFF